MQNTTTTMLYLIEPQHFESVKTEHAKFKHGFLTSELVENITPIQVISAASSMDGNVVKNKFTGAWAYLPEPLKQLFERHTKSSGGSETK